MEDDDIHDVAEAPSIFDEIDETAEAVADAEADADIVAGRVIPHADVAAWLDTWGTPEFKSAPASWFK